MNAGKAVERFVPAIKPAYDGTADTASRNRGAVYRRLKIEINEITDPNTDVHGQQHPVIDFSVFGTEISEHAENERIPSQVWNGHEGKERDRLIDG